MAEPRLSAAEHAKKASRLLAPIEKTPRGYGLGLHMPPERVQYALAHAMTALALSATSDDQPDQRPDRSGDV